MPSALSPDGCLRLVIFDCDGVLIDSEGSSCRLVAQSAAELGLHVPPDEAVERFGGKALSGLKLELESETGVRLPDDWCRHMQQRFIAAFSRDVSVIDGTHEMLDAVARLGIPVRVGSNSSIGEMDAKFGTTGLQQRFEGRIHSAADMGIPKPAPDVYLHAAAMEKVAPADCVVLEDSDTGARAALRAGMTCVLLRPLSRPAPDWPGLIRIESLAEFAPLLRRALVEQARKAS